MSNKITEKFKKNKKITILLAIAILVVIVIIGYNILFAGGNTNAVETQVIKGNIETYSTYSGTISAKKSQKIIANGNMQLKEILVSEGEYVSENTKLYEVDLTNVNSQLNQASTGMQAAQVSYQNTVGANATYQISHAEQSLISAEVNYEETKVNLERMKNLYEIEEISKKEMEDAQSSFKLAEVQLKTAQVNLTQIKSLVSANGSSAKAQLDQAIANYDSTEDQLGISTENARISGVVTKINANPTDVIAAGEVIMNIVDFNSLYVEIKVDEYEVTTMEISKEVTLYVEALEKEIKGKISSISKEASTENGVAFFTADVEFNDPDVLIGMSAEIKIEKAKATNVMLVPMEYLQFMPDNSAFVQLKGSGSSVEIRAVEVGVNDGLMVEIKSGLKEGDIIITTVTGMGSSGGMMMMGPPDGGRDNEVRGNSGSGGAAGPAGN